MTSLPLDDVLLLNPGATLDAWAMETNGEAARVCELTLAVHAREAHDEITAGAVLSSRDDRRRMISATAAVVRDRQRHALALEAIAISRSWERGARAAAGSAVGSRAVAT